MEATKRQWIQRLRVINSLEYSRLSDGLISALWEAVEKIKPIQKAVDNTRTSLAEKYALVQDGEPQTVASFVEDLQGEENEGDGISQEEIDALLADYLRVNTGRRGEILVEQEEEFREAMETALKETVALDVPQVSLQEAMRSNAPMGDLQEAVGWLVTSGGPAERLPSNGTGHEGSPA